MKSLFILLAMLFTAATAFADNSVADRSNKVISKLEIMNSLGRDCQILLELNGEKAIPSKECVKYLKNIRGKYFQSIGDECKIISGWHEKQRKMIASNPDYVDKNPSEAPKLLKEMKLSQKACDPENYSDYKYLTKPISTINSINELE